MSIFYSSLEEWKCLVLFRFWRGCFTVAVSTQNCALRPKLVSLISTESILIKVLNLTKKTFLLKEICQGSMNFGAIYYVHQLINFQLFLSSNFLNNIFCIVFDNICYIVLNNYKLNWSGKEPTLNHTCLFSVDPSTIILSLTEIYASAVDHIIINVHLVKILVFIPVKVLLIWWWNILVILSNVDNRR